MTRATGATGTPHDPRRRRPLGQQPLLGGGQNLPGFGLPGLPIPGLGAGPDLLGGGSGPGVPLSALGGGGPGLGLGGLGDGLGGGPGLNIPFGTGTSNVGSPFGAAGVGPQAQISPAEILRRRRQARGLI